MRLGCRKSPRDNVMVIDHIGIVVPSIEEGIQQWEELFGYTRNSDIVLNTRQKVRVAFLAKRNSLTIKLIEPSEPSSPVAAFARKAPGPGLVFSVQKIDQSGDDQ